MRLSANVGFLWNHLPMLGRLEAACRAGFKAVEFHWPDLTAPSAIAEQARALGLTLIGVTTSPGNLAAGEFGLGALVERESEFQMAVDQAIEFCVVTGTQNIHCLAGLVGPDERKKAREVMVSNLRIASAKAKTAGVVLVLESSNGFDQPNYLYTNLADVTSILEEVDRSNVRLQFDCYHIARSEGLELRPLLRSHMKWIQHIQIAGVPSRAEPDQGDLNYAELLKDLGSMGYAGWVGCEYKPRATVEDGLNGFWQLGGTERLE